MNKKKQPNCNKKKNSLLPLTESIQILDKVFTIHEEKLSYN